MHFQLFADVAPGNIRWRLLSGNRREIGRSVAAYADADECRVHIHLMLAQLPLMTTRVVRASSSSWSWEMLLGTQLTVVSGRRFDRQIRCAQALALFRELAPEAVIHPAVMPALARRGGGERVALMPARTGTVRLGRTLR
ncbi:hypothetical protein SAMN05444157_3454 [Frankineae bacterium MT45]|nr:hypothetical protein SAMN05444157_3454 [Frankineae bacterium MT45]